MRVRAALFILLVSLGGCSSRKKVGSAISPPINGNRQVGIDPSEVGLSGAVGDVVSGGGSLTAWVKSGPNATDWITFPQAEPWGAYSLLGADASGVLDASTIFQNVINTACASQKVGILAIPPGDFDFKSDLTVCSGLRIVGAGQFNTILHPDDSLGNIGDFITGTNTYQASTEDLSIESTTPRTAGTAITDAGGDCTKGIFGPGFGICASEFSVLRVGMNNQFDGVQIKDSASNVGAWKVYITGPATWSNFSNNNHGAIWMDSEGTTGAYANGGSFFVDQMYLAGNVSNTNTVAIRVQGTDDATITRTESFNFGYELLVDPPSGAFVDALSFGTGTYLDSSLITVAKIAPQAGGVAKQIKFNAVWFASTGSTVDNLYLAGGDAIQVTGCNFFDGQMGVRIQGELTSPSSPISSRGTRHRTSTSGPTARPETSSRATSASAVDRSRA